MRISKLHVHDVTIIVLDGQFDGNTAGDALTFFRSSYDETSKYLIADFRNVDYISSAGLRVLLCVLQELRHIKGDLRVAAIDKNVRRVFSATGFAQLMQVYDNVELGIASYAAA